MGESFVYCAALWFLLSLAIVKLTYPLVTNIIGINKWIFCLFSLIVAFLLNLFTSHISIFMSIPSWLGNVFLGLFFYGLGDLLKEQQFNRYLFFIAIIIYSFHLFFPCYLDFRFNTSRIFPLSVLYYLSGIIVFNTIFKQWGNKQIMLLTHIGKNSMVFYITHYIFFKCLFHTLHHCDLKGWPLYLCSFVIALVFLIFMDYLFRIKVFKWLIGE